MPDAEAAASTPSHRRWGRRVAAVAGVLVASLVLVVGLSVWNIDRSIDRVEVDGLGAATVEDRSKDDGAEASELDEDEALDDRESADALTVLVLGSDSREDLTREERARLGTGYTPGSRSEVVALTRLSPEDGEVRVLQVPRDSVVERCDGSRGRINAAYQVGEDDGRGGASCMVQTVTALTGVSIDHVVTVDFGGFVDVIDQIGGVTIGLDEPLEDAGSHLDLPAGCVDLDGRDALAFVRARQLDDDYGRIARQQRLVQEVLDELGTMGVIDDLPQLIRVAETVARSVELDSSLTLNRLQQLVRQHRATIQGGIDGRAAPGQPFEGDGGAWLLELDHERLDELATWLIDGEDPAEATADASEAGSAEGAVDAPAPTGSSAEGPVPSEDEDSAGPRTLGDGTPAGATPPADLDC